MASNASLGDMSRSARWMKKTPSNMGGRAFGTNLKDILMKQTAMELTYSKIETKPQPYLSEQRAAWDKTNESQNAQVSM